jgi:hypothetical protein
MELLGREGATGGDDRLAIPSVKVRAFDSAVIQMGNTHVGPKDVTPFNIDDNAIGQMRQIVHDDLSVGAIGVDRQNSAAAQVENE